MKLSVTQSAGRRIQIPTFRTAQSGPSDQVEVAVTVHVPDYVPEDVKVRSRISDSLFTAVTTFGNLERLENDPRVQSVQVGRPVRSVNGA